MAEHRESIPASEVRAMAQHLCRSWRFAAAGLRAQGSTDENAQAADAFDACAEHLMASVFGLGVKP